ncbi:hypothetical protein RJ53_09760 [Methanocalculus chunghsingensis]|uniref:Transglutaminase-like domain-containing protein n=2 Tax=Methanocalculus chunghsingensis TaxID=156457 RepID=A0A8J8B656_9EURY|nr:hypothetical protein [Methanocalculus chunghsingensis]
MWIFNVISLVMILLLLTTVTGCLESEQGQTPFMDEEIIPLPSYTETSGVSSSSQVTWLVSQLPDEKGVPLNPERPITHKTSNTAEAYRWFYNGAYYSWTIYIPADKYNYFATLPRDKPHPVDYVMSDRGRGELQGVVSELISLSTNQGFNEIQRRDFIIAFVQSLPHNRGGSVHDYDGYPKYPIQTIYDGGGDSQDTSILLASILRLLGHPAVLIETPDHYMVGLIEPEADREKRKQIIQSEGYTIIESNHPGFSIGNLPVQYHRALKNPVIHIPSRNPDVNLQFQARLIYTDQAYAYYQVYSTITSTGTGPASDLRVIMTGQPVEGLSWRYDEVRTVSTIPEGEVRLIEGTVRIPRNAEAEIICTISGPGMAEKKYRSQVFYT